MDGIRGSIGRMSAVEAEALRLRIAADAERTHRTEVMTLALFLVLGGLLLGAFLLILRQVRGRQALLDQVQANAARMSGIFENAQDGLLTFNRSGTIESINQAGQTMFGVSREQTQGRDAGLLFDLPEDGKVFLERLSGEHDSAHGVTRELIATQGVYFSHETCTHATPTASCAYNEVSALRKCFGPLLESLIIINTKVLTRDMHTSHTNSLLCLQ